MITLWRFLSMMLLFGGIICTLVFSALSYEQTPGQPDPYNPIAVVSFIGAVIGFILLAASEDT